MVAKIECVSVHELLFVFFASLLSIVAAFANCAHDYMWYVEQPETY